LPFEGIPCVLLAAIERDGGGTCISHDHIVG
jgi:hypothetical protein